MDFKLELVAIPVTDVDRAKAFYGEGSGSTVTSTHQVNDELRFVQLTPPGSACSISIGTGITDADPGSVKGMQMTVNDIDAAAAELRARGVEPGEIQDFPWGRFLFLADPDGNRWAIQQVPPWSAP
jgi:predicted enzyme related to lactoylglutathione lyase